MDGLWTEVRGQQKQSSNLGNNQDNLNTPTTGRHWRANGTPCHIQHSPGTPTSPRGGVWLSHGMEWEYVQLAFPTKGTSTGL